MIDETSELVTSHGSKATDARGIGQEWSGDAVGAEAAFPEADDAGLTAASFILAELLAEQGDGHGAIAAFQRAVRRSRAAPAFSLGGLVAESGDARALINAYCVAAKCGDQEASYQLGLLYLDRGDLKSARSAFAKADKLGHAWAALGLGEILEHTGDRSGAIAAYRRAADRRVTVAGARRDELLAGSGYTDNPIAASRQADEVALAEPTQPTPLGARTAPQGWTRRRLVWAVGIVAAFVALLSVTLVTLLPTASPRTAAGVRTAPSTTARHQPSPRQPTSNTSGAGERRAGATSPAKGGTTIPATRARAGGVAGLAPQDGRRPTSPSPAPSFTAKQSALLANVPGTAHAQCLPGAEAPLPRSDASIRCFSPSTGVTALYYGYTSRAQLRRLFHNYRAWFASRRKLRDCAGRTHGEYFQGSASTITGRWACFYNDRTVPQSACIDWADYSLLIFGSACQADRNFTALEAWWRHAGPVPASTHDLANRD